jgi:hypothetical protein
MSTHVYNNPFTSLFFIPIFFWWAVVVVVILSALVRSLPSPVCRKQGVDSAGSN